MNESVSHQNSRWVCEEKMYNWSIESSVISKYYELGMAGATDAPYAKP